MDTPIIGEKVHRPDPRGLARERLEHRLLDPYGPGVALVLGPPGSGKTTLLSRVATVADRPCAWYRASPEDHAEVALVRHVGHALAVALGADQLAAAGRVQRVDDLLAALDRVAAQPAQLVVDDLHVIVGSAAERALERFLVLRPRSIRVLLASRRPPLINTSRLLVNGDLGQLDGEDLRFRSWEVEELFRTFYRRPLSPEAAAALTRRTGGWAAGLQLFHLGTSDLTRYEREQAVVELTGRSRLIRSYLTRNVLEGLDHDRRHFLLTTCTLGELTGPLCDALLGAAASAGVLDELERQQFFTSSTDGGTTFRYHQVLQTHLEVLLVDEVGAAEVRRRYARSAALLEADGRTAAALRAYARAEDWGAVARLLHADPSCWPADDAWLETLGRSTGVSANDPGLVVAGARWLFRQGRVEEAVRAYRQAETLMDDPDFRARCARERDAAAVWLPGAPAGRRAPTPAPDWSLSLRGLTRDPTPPAAAAPALVHGFAHLLAGDPATATRTWAAALPRGARGSGESLAVRLALLVAEAREGPDESAPGRLEEVVLSADLAGLPWLSRLARGLQAAALLVTQPTPWRADACRELVEECERQGDRWAVCLLSGVTGWWSVRAAGQERYGVAWLTRAADCARVLDAPVLERWLRAALARNPAAPDPTARAQPDRTRDEAEPAGKARSVELRCLGAFELSVDGRPVSWRRLRPKVQSLLHLLALQHGRPVHRERLIDVLWPEATLTSGTRSLQVAVSSLRRCLVAAGLPDASVRRQGDAYALQLPRVDDQVRDFERLVRAGARAQTAGDAGRALDCWTGALDRYAGELLPEAGPAEWVVEERDRLRLLAAEAGADAARAALDLGELARGVRAARRSVELDPYHDTSWQVLTELLERLGDPSAAAVCRREHAAALADLGLPAPSAVRLER